MYDFNDTPAAPSSAIVRPVLSGAALGLAAVVIFFLAFIILPGVSLTITSLLAVAIAVGLFAVLGRHLPASAPGTSEGGSAVAEPSRSLSPAEVEIEELEAQIARLREEAASTDRRQNTIGWVNANLSLGQAYQDLATRQATTLGQRGRRVSFGNFRIAANTLRRIGELRGIAKFPEQMILANISCAECLLTLAAAEQSHEHAEEAAQGFANVLAMPQLEAAHRERAQAGLTRAEELLANLADDRLSAESARDDLF